MSSRASKGGLNASRKGSARTRRDVMSEGTRRAILRAARQVFARRGYAGTSLSAVVRAAKVTTGAVYHHFGDKQGLFRAVAEQVEAEILERILAAARPDTDPWTRFLVCTNAMFAICTEPDVHRIVFLDAPNVIGAAEWRAIEMRFGLGAMHQGLAELKDAGRIRAGSIDVLAPILMGALIEAANTIARAEPRKRAATMTEAQATITRLLESLKVDREAARRVTKRRGPAGA
jgi:AcrR family transcriptional regulator